jgi:CheY-like chemotaxis protein
LKWKAMFEKGALLRSDCRWAISRKDNMENKASILIVDDNISLCKTMSFVLRRKGYAVVTANNGPVAIEMVKERPFDIVFMDIKMSPMDGVETYINL